MPSDAELQAMSGRQFAQLVDRRWGLAVLGGILARTGSVTVAQFGGRTAAGHGREVRPLREARVGRNVRIASPALVSRTTPDHGTAVMAEGRGFELTGTVTAFDRAQGCGMVMSDGLGLVVLDVTALQAAVKISVAVGQRVRLVADRLGGVLVATHLIGRAEPLQLSPQPSSRAMPRVPMPRMSADAAAPAALGVPWGRANPAASWQRGVVRGRDRAGAVVALLGFAGEVLVSEAVQLASAIADLRTGELVEVLCERIAGGWRASGVRRCLVMTRPDRVN